LNQQQLLPLVQALALPLYWLIGREAAGLGPAAATGFMLVAPGLRLRHLLAQPARTARPAP